MPKISRNYAIVLIATLFGAQWLGMQSAIAEEAGQVCISPVAEHPEAAGERKFGRRNLADPKWHTDYEFDYAIQIDDGPKIKTSAEKSLLYPALDYQKRHIVKIYAGDRLKESFWMSFPEHETNKLCLWFNGLYETWILWPQEGSEHLCSCGD